MNTSRWDERIDRAKDLAMAHPSASEVLLYYERILGFQKSFILTLNRRVAMGRRLARPGRCAMSWIYLFCCQSFLNSSRSLRAWPLPRWLDPQPN